MELQTLKKSIFVRDQKVCQKVLHEQNRAKHLQKITQKIENGDNLCIFAFKNPNLVQSLKNFAQPYGRMDALFRNSVELHIYSRQVRTKYQLQCSQAGRI